MKNICTHCEAENDIRSKYCSVCGYQLPAVENQNTKTESEQPKTAKTKKPLNWKAIVGFIFGFAVMFYVTQSLFTPSIDSQLESVASEMNKNCPMNVDQYTILKNVVALPDKTFQYNYTLVGKTKAEVQIDTVKKYFFPQLLQNVKTDPTMKLFRDNEVTLSYTYYDTTGEFIIDYVIKPEMYQ
jgi:hypothetical protein